MKLKFGVTEITQDMILRPLAGSDFQVLEDPAGEGYRKSLSRGYLKGIREYLEAARREEGAGERRFLLLSPERFVARQGYLVLRRKLSAWEEAPEDEYGDYYEKNPLSALAGRTPERTLIVSEQAGAEQEPAEFMALMPFARPVVKRGTGDATGLGGEESVLVEVDGEEEPDRIVENILALENRWVAVSMKPGGSGEYMMKRLVFEGNYRVIRLERPSREDYLGYVRDYLEYHHFTAQRGAISRMLDGLRTYRGELMSERDIYLHLDRCFERAVVQGKRHLDGADIDVVYDGQGLSAAEEMERVVGLEQVKHMIRRRLGAAKLMRDMPAKLHCNYIMEGPPGTGKSKMARLTAKLMGEAGVSNGKFVDASRADIIGKYVGHTAANVRAVFQRAEGGVLFVDEASFLLGDDAFVKEAVIEFVRYMELCPQTMVIFATYPKEGRRLLMCDPGFRSRIYQILSFNTYSDQELYEILEVMARDYDFSLEEGCREELYRYIAAIRERKNFGNAREVRRLLETAVEEYGLRAEAEQEEEGRADGGETGRDALASSPGKRMLTAADIRGAAGYLLASGQEEAGFGFGVRGGMEFAVGSDISG